VPAIADKNVVASRIAQTLGLGTVQQGAVKARWVCWLLAVWVLGVAPAAHAGVGTRIFYVSNWSGHEQVYAVDPAGRASLGQVTPPDARNDLFEPQPSPDGRHVLYRSHSADSLGPSNPPQSSVWLAQTDGRAQELVPPPASMTAAAWSPDSRLLAYIVQPQGAPSELRVVHADGSGDHRVLTPQSGRIVWSRDSRRVRIGWGPCCGAYSPDQRWGFKPDGTQIVVFPAGHDEVGLALEGSWPVWSPDSRFLAFVNGQGINVFDVRTRTSRLLTGGDASQLTWSPDGRSLAYIAAKQGPPNSVPLRTAAEVRAVSLDGHVRVVMEAAAPYGAETTPVPQLGVVSELAWARAPDRPYPRPQLATGVYTLNNVHALAADAGRIAYAACGLAAWTPALGLVSPLPLLPPLPGIPQTQFCGAGVYDLTVAGDRIAYATINGGNQRYWALHELLANGITLELTSDVALFGDPTQGRLAGAGDVLVYERAGIVQLVGDGPPLFSAQQTQYQQPMLLDVDGDNVLVAQAGSVTVVSTADRGIITQLAIAGDPTVNIARNYTAPPDAQLSGNHVIVRSSDLLLDYGLDSGAPLHSWPLATGARLQDAAHGLVAYTADRYLHVLRLSDGLDRTIATATLAHFMDDGLAYANGARVNVIPNAQLTPS
jgi:hypothetical protein